MAILQATLTGSLFGQLVINTWNYVSTGDPGATIPSFALISAMGFGPPTGPGYTFEADKIGESFQNTVAQAYQFKSFYVRNLYAPSDFFEVAYHPSTIGQSGGVATSPAFAYGLRSSRTRTDIRRGSKRIPGVTEEGLLAGGEVTGMPLLYLNTLASRMSADLAYTVGGASLSFSSAVLGFREYTTPRGRRAYEKWPTEIQQLEHSSLGVDWSVVSMVRTQASRQYSRGA